MPDLNYKYILFTHLPNKPEAWDTFAKVFQDTTGTDATGEALGEALGERLSMNAAPGMLVVFIDTGWLPLLNTIGADFDPVAMSQEFNKLKDVQAKVDKLLTDYPSLQDRLRLVTAATLFPILNNLRGNKPGLEATRLQNFLVGNDPGVRYDTTKVVEALIRIRHLGSGIPVLRIDWDALLNSTTLFFHNLDRLILNIPKYSAELSANYRVHSYVISGSYVRPTRPMATWKLNDFNTAFATRMFPALLPTRAALEKIQELSEAQHEKKEAARRAEAEKTGKPFQPKPMSDDSSLSEGELKALEPTGFFNRSVMSEYYDRMSAIGSDPHKSVISGAGLVISDGAILDLPPFSNLRQSVMWIDDHLKYELHRALGHFSKVASEYSSGAPIVPARELGAGVYKDRLLAGQGNVRKYSLGSYIPTVFYGVLVDAWIRGEPVVEGKQTPFVAALERSLKRGIFDDSERLALKQELRIIAVARINKLVSMWSALKAEDQTPTFAALWVGGDKAAIETVLEGLVLPEDKWLGWGLLKNPQTTIADLSELFDPLNKIVLQLIDDMCNYIDWTLEWPKFIQSVRAIKSGSLALDVSYVEPERTK